MLALSFFFVLFAVVAGGVVAYATFTHRGVPLPGSPMLNERVDRWHDSVSARVGGPLENTAVSGALITHSVVMTPEKDGEARDWFISIERRMVGKLPPFARRRLEAHLAPTLRSSENSTSLV